MILTIILIILWIYSTVCIYKLEGGKGMQDVLICSMWFVTIPLFLILWKDGTDDSNKGRK